MHKLFGSFRGYWGQKCVEAPKHVVDFNQIEPATKQDQASEAQKESAKKKLVANRKNRK